MYLSQDVFAARPPFPNVQLGDPSDDWTFEHTKTSLGLVCNFVAPDNRTLCVDRQPLSMEECKIRDPLTEESNFPSPDISSISYTSDGKVLNATAWLKHPFGFNVGNNTDIPFSFITEENISQPSYSVNVMHAGNKTLNEAVEEHIDRTSRNLTTFHLSRNESGPINIQGIPSHKIVYTYRGDKLDVCEKCVETDVLTMKDGKLYLFMFWGENQKYNELLATALKMFNSTDIGFQLYENPTLNVQVKYPRDWNTIEDFSGITFLPPQNNTDGLLEGVSVYSTPLAYDVPLEELSNSYIDILNSTLFGFSYIKSEPINLPEGQAHRIIYTYLHESGLHVAASTVFILYEGIVYSLEFNAEQSRYTTLIPLVEEMLKSLTIGQLQGRQQNQETVSGYNNLYSYENSTYRLRLEYPYDWLVDETNILFDPKNNIVSLLSPSLDRFQEQLRITIDHDPGVIQGKNQIAERHNLERYLNKTKQNYEHEHLRSFRVISDTADSWLSDRPAYRLEYQFRANGLPIKVIEHGIIAHHDKVFKVQFFSELEQFSNYSSILQNMMDSLEFEIPALTYKDSYFEIEYPYNWTRLETSLGNLPAGYFNQSDFVRSIYLLTPIDAQYYIFKTYRIDFDYDYSYKRAGNTLPYVIAYDASKNVNLEGTPLRSNWTKIIAENQGENSRILVNSTRDDNGFVNEDEGYVYWSIDLDSLNLPDQFYITFAAREAFVKDGQLCNLIDNTDLVGSPPPEYSMNLSPAYIQDVRPGEERNVKVEIKTNSTLPFHTTFAAQEEDLELMFEPNKIPGTEGGITTSNLKIKVLPNATGNTQHIFTVHANIFLTPTFNPSNATSANITKRSDFTITILPAKDFGDQINDAWGKFGSSLSGFGGLLVTVLAVVGTVGGWFLAKRKGKQKDKSDYYKENYRIRQNEDW